MEIRLNFLDKTINLKREYMTPIEYFFIIFITGLLIGVYL